MANEPSGQVIMENGQVIMEGFEPINQLIHALEILREMIPEFNNGDAAGFEEWRQQVKERMTRDGISLEYLRKITPPGEITGISLDGGEITLHIDGPDIALTESAEQRAAFAFLCNWILSEQPIKPTVIGASGLPQELLSKRFFPMLNGPMVTDIMQLSLAKMEPDPLSNSAVYITKDGRKLKMEKFNEVEGTLSVSAKKLLNHAILYLKESNYYRGHPNSIIPTVEIPLEEYGALTGRQITPLRMSTPQEQEAENARALNNLKQFKKSIRRDLHDISSLVWTAEELKGRNRGNYVEMRIISSHSIRRGNILRINFDVDAAAYLLNAYLMQYPKVLYKYDERKPNAFAIAYKIALHNSNDNNFIRGTNNTLSVASLLDAAPDIPTYERLKETGNRNWKAKIKGVLEKAIDESIDKGFLNRWEYRDPKTGKTYTAAQANTLTYLQWYRLMIDFIVIDAPDQTERREAKAEAKKLAEEAKAAEPVKRKRGRPRKNPEK